MLDRHRRAHGRLKRVSIASGLVPSVTLLDDLVRYLNGTKSVRGKGVLVILEKMLKLEEMTKGIVGPILLDLVTMMCRFKVLCLLTRHTIEGIGGRAF